jgi:hypothetical protein
MYAYILIHTISLFDLLCGIALGHDKAQNIIDQITSAYETGGGPPPGGFGFGPQHLGGPSGMGGPGPSFGPPGGGGYGPPIMGTNCPHHLNTYC